MSTAPEFTATDPVTRVADPHKELGISPSVVVSARHSLGSDDRSTRSIRIVAAAISSLMHLAFIIALLLPSTNDRAARQVNYNAQAQPHPNEEQVTTVFFIPDDAQHPSQKFPAQTSLDSPIVMSDFTPEMAVPELELSVEDTTDVQSVERNRAALATARVAYLSQIQARIERTWDHPLVSLDHSFHCRVKIQQTLQGEIKALKLADCDGDEVWQQSLLRAVRNAAPFPAPRDEKSFVEELTLDFKTDPVSLAALFTLLETLPDNAKAQIPQGPSLRPQVY